MRFLVQWLIDRPRRVAAYLTWLAPLFARITVGWVFLWSGWGKLHNLAQVIDNFIGWGIPYPQVLTPFVAGVEFFGGLFLLLGFLTRISAGALGVTMIVAIRAAKWAEVDSLETLLGFHLEGDRLVLDGGYQRHNRDRHRHFRGHQRFRSAIPGTSSLKRSSSPSCGATPRCCGSRKTSPP